MPKSYNTYGNNAQTRGGFLSELPKGDCIQITSNGMTKTEGKFDIFGSSIDTPADEPTYYHRPSFGVTSRKQPSGGQRVMLARLLENPFNDDRKMEEFSFDHWNSHKQIIQALQNLFGVQFIDYPIYPYNKRNQQEWLIMHQSMHNAFTGYLQFTGSDLNRVDFNDPQQQQEWISENYTEHYSAHVALGLSA